MLQLTLLDYVHIYVLKHFITFHSSLRIYVGELIFTKNSDNCFIKLAMYEVVLTF